MTGAQVRRLLALAPDADATGLYAALSPLAPPEVIDHLRAYLFDRRARPLAHDVTGPLFAPVPGGVAPIDDRIAAILVAPTVGLAQLLIHRWSPRADDLVALVVAHQPLPAQPAVLLQLAVDLGPDPDTLALSTLQCGRVLAWAPHLLEWPIAEELVGALLALFDPDRPEPLIALAARALAPLAARRGPLPELVRSHAHAALSRGPALAGAGAYILGFAGDPAGALEETFLDGLVAAANVPRISDLVATGLAEGDEVAALGLAARIPLDPLAAVLRAAQDDPDYGALAALACAQLEGASEPPLVALPAPPPDPSRDEIVRGLSGDREQRFAALAVAGRVLPAEHTAWRQILEIFEGDDRAARDLAWCALRDRARRD